MHVGAFGQLHLRGTVVDEHSRRNIGGALVTIERATALTDTLGHFDIRLKRRGRYIVQLTHLSYEAATFTLRITGDTTVVLSLRSKPYSLSEVTVSGVTSERKSANLTISAIDMRKNIPVLGEGNIGLVLQQKPGVAHAQEINPGLFVRGFSNSQNKVFLNGSPIFNSNHLLGIYPSVNANAVAKTQLLSDDVHPRYGDFLSSCLVMEGNSQLADTSVLVAGVGVLTSHIYSRAPIVKGRVSYELAARRSYFDLISRTYNQLNGSKSSSADKLPDYRLYDVNGLVTIQPTHADRVVLSLFHSGDKLSQQQSYLGLDATWGNTAANLCWDRNLSKALSIRTNGGYSCYSTRTSIVKSDVSHVANSVGRLYLSVEGTAKVGAAVQVDVGLFGGRTRTSIDNDSQEINGNESVLSEKTGRYGSAGGYVALSTPLGRYLQVKAGLRMEAYAGNRPYLSPRLYLQSPITSQVTLFASYSQRQQFDHLYAPMGINLPIDMIIPSDDTLKPQQSRQVGAGAAVRLGRYTQLLLSAYYSTLAHQVDFVNPEPLNEGFYYTVGRGDAKGVELSASYKTAALSVEASYSLAQTRRQFSQINGGRWFSPPFDIRHKADLFVYLRLTPRWSLSLSQFVQSGNIVTVPTSIYYNQAKKQLVPVYTSRYNLRLPLAHRLDVSAQYTVRQSFGELRLSLGIYNLYNQANPYFIYFKPEKMDDEQTRFVTKKRSLLPMVPFFMIEVTL